VSEIEGLTDILDDETIRMGIEADTGLTPEAIFVDEFLRTGNAFMACNRAGMADPRYPIEVMARRTLARPEIQAAITLGKRLMEKQPKLDANGLYSREFLLDGLQRTHEQAFTDRSYSAAISAIKVQAAMLGFMEQTVNINHTTSAKELSLDELRRMVLEGRPGDGAINITPSIIEGALTGMKLTDESRGNDDE